MGLKQSPSVVFSSASDLAVEKQTGQTSSEEASLNEGINNDGAKDELEPQQVRFPLGVCLLCGGRVSLETYSFSL